VKIVSACLVGINCKWNGKSKPIPKLVREQKEGKLLPLCPEQLGGLPTPRPPCGLLGGTGKDVWAGKAKVIDHQGKSYTRKFKKGALEVLRIAQELGIKEAVLRTSPSCGVGQTWQMRKVREGYRCSRVGGDGVLAALLRKKGFKVLSANEVG